MYKTIQTSLLCLFLLFIPTIIWAETYEDLYKKGGIYYKKFTDTPFTGEINQKFEKGSYKDGKLHGTYYNFDEKGRLTFRGEYKNGLPHGSYVSYITNPFNDDEGQLVRKGVYKKGKKEGYWEYYFIDGTIDSENTGQYSNGVKTSD